MKLRKLYQGLFLLLTVFITSFISLLLVFHLAEGLFFDQLIYQKSPLHGYLITNDSSTSVEWSASQILELKDKFNPLFHRTEALRQVFSDNTPKTLGANTNDDTFTITLIGDSLIYGTGVREKFTTGSVLEKKLNDLDVGIHFEVITLALPGDSIIDNFIKFRQSLSSYNSDLFIVTIVDNDLDIWCNKYPGGVDYCLQLKQACPKPLLINSQKSKSLSWQQFVNYFYAHSDSQEYANICFFKKVVKEMISTGPNALFFLPSQLTIDDEFLTNTQAKAKKVNIHLLNVIENNQGQVVTLDELESFYYQPVSETESHPSKITHQAYAQLLLQKVVEKLNQP